MSVTPTEFRTNFPQFAAVNTYPDGAISFWLGIATLELNPSAFPDINTPGDLYDYYTQLYAAHNLALWQKDMRAASMGASVGQISGPTSSKGIDKVHVSYDTSAARIEGAGDLNLTTYGIKLARAYLIYGAGCWQLVGNVSSAGVVESTEGLPPFVVL